MNLLFYNAFRYRVEDYRLLDYTNLWMGKPYINAIKYFVEECRKNGITCEALRNFNRSGADAFAIWELPRGTMGELEQEGYRYILSSGKPIYAFLTEPPIVSPEGGKRSNAVFYDKFFTWRSDLIDNTKYFPIRPMFFDFEMPRKMEIPYSCKKLCVVIGHVLSSLFTSQDAIYSRRKDVLDWFADNHPNDIDLYGKQPYGVGALRQYPFFCGASDDKRETLTKYRFSFCYENSRFPNYITEKLFDCFISGCVPIYMGAPNVNNHVPSGAYINPEDFEDLNELYEYIFTLTETDYDRYISVAKDFLLSDFAESYKPNVFTDTVINVLLKDEVKI